MTRQAKGFLRKGVVIGGLPVTALLLLLLLRPQQNSGGFENPSAVAKCPVCQGGGGASEGRTVAVPAHTHDRWPKRMTHDVRVTQHTSKAIGTKNAWVVEVDEVPVFAFEKGAGDGYPQEEPYWEHHKFLQPVNKYKPAQLNQEIALVLSYLHLGGTMLEWGSGGSTIFYSPNVKSYHAVEHNKNWADLVRSTCNERGLDNVHVHHVAADKKRSPDSTREGEFETYCNVINTLGVNRFDFILIDGRARQFCAKAILPYVDEHSRVFVHDFPLRERYFSVFDDFFQVASVFENGAHEKGLVVLQPRAKPHT